MTNYMQCMEKKLCDFYMNSMECPMNISKKEDAKYVLTKSRNKSIQ